jgi:tRNA 2-selenouridine synthase
MRVQAQCAQEKRKNTDSEFAQLAAFCRALSIVLMFVAFVLSRFLRRSTSWCISPRYNSTSSKTRGVSLEYVSGHEALRWQEHFDAVIDVRSPCEYAEDHVVGAENWPILSDAEREQVGKQYALESFKARIDAAPVVARNLSEMHLKFRNHPKSWRALIYCWRGGLRSQTVAFYLKSIGFHVKLVDGGYKSIRNSIIEQLEQLPKRFHFRVLCGATGCGKTEILKHLSNQHEQVLNLEDLGNHRGSILGHEETAQPTQRHFEMRIVQQLRAFESNRVVFVESESKKLGKLRIPDLLMETIRNSPCFAVEMEMEHRIRFIIRTYDSLKNSSIVRLLELLRKHKPKEIVDRWIELANSKNWEELVRRLIVEHYDASYQRSLNANFKVRVETFRVDDDSLNALNQTAKLIAAHQTNKIESS